MNGLSPCIKHLLHYRGKPRDWLFYAVFSKVGHSRHLVQDQCAIVSECITVIRSLSFFPVITVCLDSATLVCLIRPLCRTMGFERRRARFSEKILSVVFQKPKQITTTRRRRDTQQTAPLHPPSPQPPSKSSCNQPFVNMSLKRRWRSELVG